MHSAQLDQQRLRDWHFDAVDSELELLNRIIDLVHELDPDIMTGWEVQTTSWGFLSARARTFGWFFYYSATILN